MPSLRDIRRLFHRRSRPVVVDVSGTQAEGLAGARGDGEISVAVNAPGKRRQARGLGGMVEPKPLRPRGNRDVGANLEEVMCLVRQIGVHLESQGERSDRLFGLIERLPEALDALPEINRQNAHLLDALDGHFNQTQAREEALTSTLGRMTDTQDLLREALTDLARSSSQSTEVLCRMADSTARRESETTVLLMRSQRWLVAIGLCCGMASLAALAVACLALLK